MDVGQVNHLIQQALQRERQRFANQLEDAVASVAAHNQPYVQEFVAQLVTALRYDASGNVY